MTLLYSKANGTVVAYNHAFRRWKQYSNYLQHIIEGTHSPCSVDSTFYGLKWAHDVAGTPFPTHDPIVEAVRTASKRVLGTSVLSDKEPILPP